MCHTVIIHTGIISLWVFRLRISSKVKCVPSNSFLRPIYPYRLTKALIINSDNIAGGSSFYSIRTSNQSIDFNFVNSSIYTGNTAIDSFI